MDDVYKTLIEMYLRSLYHVYDVCVNKCQFLIDFRSYSHLKFNKGDIARDAKTSFR